MTAGRLRTGSLRVRVTVAVVLLLAVALAGLALLVHSVLGERLRSDLRSRLVERAAFARVLERDLTGQQLADRLTGAGITASVVDGDQVLTGRDQGPPAGGPPRPRTRPAPVPATTPAAPVEQDGSLLRIRETLSSGATVTLRATTVEVDATLRRLATVETVGGLGVLAVAAGLCAGLMGWILRPLRQMTALARDTAAGRRGGRLRPDRPGTDLGTTAAAFDDMLEALERSAAEARAAEDRLRRFLSDASHELRTPVAAVQASAETLLRDESSDREELAVAAIRAARRAGRLVDDLLVMARADEGAALALTTGPVDLAAVAADGVARCRLLAGGAARITLASAGPTAVEGDARRLAQVVDNLLDNARRAIPGGGAVTVTVRGARGRVRLVVADTGPGLAAADRERAFERFTRLRPESYEGSGLGLPLARALARAHGGDVSWEPSAVGARFVLELPAATPVPLTAQLELAAGP